MAHALRGEILSFDDDPSRSPRALRHWPDGLAVIEAGKIKAVGSSAELLPTLAPGITLDDWSGRLILPGLVDAHVHYSQVDIIASEAPALLPWLERHTFPAESAFSDPEVGRETASFFLDELLRSGTTSALVFATVHPSSVDALFEAAEARHMRIASGKVLMDRNCPENLRDTARSGYEDSLALIRRWHGKGRLSYAVSPRFAVSSSDEQLQAAARLYREHDGVLMQTHVAENKEEVDWVRRLFPGDESYVAVYERFGLLGPRAVLAHGVHLDDRERARLAASGAAIAFCPSANLFLGSGLFDYGKAQSARVPVALATDVGAGTSLSMLRTMQDAYKVCRLAGRPFSALDAFYLATLAGAKALGVDSLVGAIAPGREADLVVLDPLSIPTLARRTARALSLEERLFALMMLGDERCVAATYVLGTRVMPRSAPRTSGRRESG